MTMVEFKCEGLRRTCGFQGRSQDKKSEAGWVVVAHAFSWIPEFECSLFYRASLGQPEIHTEKAEAAVISRRLPRQ